MAKLDTAVDSRAILRAAKSGDRSPCTWRDLVSALACLAALARERVLHAPLKPAQAAQHRLLEQQLDRTVPKKEFAGIEAQLLVCRAIRAMCHGGPPPDDLAHSAISVELTSLLADTAAARALRRFREAHPGQDPATPICEELLAREDAHERKRRGVFYTPEPLAAFIVRAVHHALQRELGLADGLADVTTWRQLMRIRPGVTTPEGVDPAAPVAQILDPAAGTGVFLVQVIRRVYRTLRRRWAEEGLDISELPARWNRYVRRHLLPRLHAWELMPAAWAVARLNVEFALRETGCVLGPADRLHIRAGNSLFAAGTVPFTAVIGNPPYAGTESPAHPSIGALLADYRRGLNETNVNALSDDYVRFTALAHASVLRAGTGVIGFVTNSTFLEGTTHRRMRERLCRDFSSIRILNLHGSVLRRDELAPGERDQSVFNIRQGVAVTILARDTVFQPGRGAGVTCAALKGTRADKLRILSGPDRHLAWSPAAPAAPHFLLRPSNAAPAGEYHAWPSLTDVFQQYASGIKFRRDALLIKKHFHVSSVHDMLRDASSLERQAFVSKYHVRESPDWRFAELQPLFAAWRPEDIVEVLYRPFDVRHAFYPLNGVRRLIPRGDSRARLMTHLLKIPNLGLMFNRQVVGRSVSHFFVTRRPVSHGAFYLGNKGQDYVAPLHLLEGGTRKSNIHPAFVERLCSAAGLADPPGPERVFHYLYAVVHSPAYRSRYDALLRIDFPRVPLPASSTLFTDLCRLGAELVAAHLLAGTHPASGSEDAATRGDAKPLPLRLCGQAPPVVRAGYPRFHLGGIQISQDAWLEGVPESVWTLEVGGYAVAQKWLRDRRGRPLAEAELREYRAILQALRETGTLMHAVDDCIARAGGWPGAFAGAQSL